MGAALKDRAVGELDPRDLAAFGAAVRRVLDDGALAEELGAAARARVLGHFLGTRSLLSYLELLERLRARAGEQRTAQPARPAGLRRRTGTGASPRRRRGTAARGARSAPSALHRSSAGRR